MMCGTTPKLIFTLPFDVGVISKIKVICKQGDVFICKKNTEDCTLDGNVVTTKLTQEETLAINYKKPVDVQLRILDVNGEPLNSVIKTVRFGRCLDDEVMI